MPTEVDAFRSEVRQFVAEHGPRLRAEGVRVPCDDEEEARVRGWLGSLFEVGYLGGGWPREWGGRSQYLPVHDLIVMEELIRAGVYRPLDQVMLAAHAIIGFGTDTQKEELLPKIRSGAHIWCQLFSEPDVGSDLASLRTRADSDGAGFVVTGQKIWSTDAQWADMGLLLARTDPGVDRHAGLSAFLVPMETPGIDVRPIREMTGFSEYCEVFLDGVRLGPQQVLGGLNGGWRVVTSGLASERAFVGANALQLEMMFADLVALAEAVRFPDGSTALAHEDVRIKLARALAAVEEVKLVTQDTVDRILLRQEQRSDGPIAKLSYSETNVALCELALELMASSTSIEEHARAVSERWHHNFLWSRALTISGGSSEILRGLIGRQLLELPRA